MAITIVTIDDFERPDALNLGPDWKQIISGEPRRLRVSGGVAYCPAGPTILDEIWAPQEFGPDVEVRLALAGDLITRGGQVRLYARLVSPYPGVPASSWPFPWNAQNHGYVVTFTGPGNSVQLVSLRTFPDTNTMIDTGTFSLGMTAIALRCEGSTISALAYYAATGWGTVASGTDTVWPDAGYVGMGLSATAGLIGSGFFGGEDEPPPPLVSREAWGVLAR